MGDVPRPGMPQEEKDRLGLLQLREQERGGWAADDDLEGMTREELEAEASVRRVDLSGARTNQARVNALRDVDPLPDRGRQSEEPEAEESTGEFDVAADEGETTNDTVEAATEEEG